MGMPADCRPRKYGRLITTIVTSAPGCLVSLQQSTCWAQKIQLQPRQFLSSITYQLYRARYSQYIPFELGCLCQVKDNGRSNFPRGKGLHTYREKCKCQRWATAPLSVCHPWKRSMRFWNSQLTCRCTTDSMVKRMCFTSFLSSNGISIT